MESVDGIEMNSRLITLPIFDSHHISAHFKGTDSARSLTLRPEPNA